MKYSLVIFLLFVICFTFLETKITKKKTKSHEKKLAHRIRQQSTSLDDCVLEYNASLFCKFNFPNDPADLNKCLKDTIKSLKDENKYCVPCIKRLFSKVIGKIHIYSSVESIDSSESESAKEEQSSIQSLKKEAIKSILSKLLFTSKNCDLAPNNLKQAYVEFVKASGNKKWNKSVEKFMKNLNVIVNNNYESPYAELSNCPKVKIIADEVYEMLTCCKAEKADDGIKAINTLDRKKQNPAKKVKNLKLRLGSNAKENSMYGTFSLVADLAKKNEESPKSSEDNKRESSDPLPSEKKEEKEELPVNSQEAKEEVVENEKPQDLKPSRLAHRIAMLSEENLDSHDDETTENPGPIYTSS